MSTTQETLTAIFDRQECPLPEANRTVALRKLSVRTLKPVVDLVAAVLASDGSFLTKLAAPRPEAAEGTHSDVGITPDIILKLISGHYDAVVSLLPSFCSLTQEEVYDLSPGDGIVLLQAVVILNKDFFTKTVLPALALSKAVADAGPTPEA